MYKVASEKRQHGLDRKQVLDGAVAAGHNEKLSKNETRRIFARVMAELDRQIVMAPPKSARRRELGLRKLALQTQREKEKGIGVGSGKVNQLRIWQLFRIKIFAVLPDDAQRIWNEAEAQAREEMLNATDSNKGASGVRA